MDEAGGFTVGLVLREANALANRHARTVATWILATGIGLGLLDVLMDRIGAHGNAGSSIAMTVIGYHFASRVLFAEGLTNAETPGRFGSFFGAAFLSALGVIVGLVLLVVPGVMLATRWYLAPVMTIAERRRATDSLGASAAATAGNRWQVFGLLVVFWTGFVAALLVTAIPIGVAGSMIGTSAAITVASAIVINVIVAACQLAGYLLQIAAYTLLSNPHSRLREVFA